ncbi:MAG: bifunctional transaldolase/phosoglucose isomerase [Acidobacteriota bacterium]
MNPLRQLTELGQAVWLDFIRRKMLQDGELARLVKEDGLRGMTSNPSIFQQAIGGSDDYDEQLATILTAEPSTTATRLYEALAIEDIRQAADLLLPVYEGTGGDDGYVSLEVSPYLAHDTEATLEEARRLWAAVDRPNLMVKVPGTAAGVPAIEALTADGININVTLLFALADYEAVAQAYVRGLERCTAPERVASVASFFVSRVDSAVDAQLESLAQGAPGHPKSEAARALLGTTAICNAKLAYRRFEEIFRGDAFAALAARGARPQRVLWASTSTKNPAYRDVLYVEQLIGSDTVNTLPPKTLAAFRDHGEAQETLSEDVQQAAERIAALKILGVDLDAVTDRLQADGVAAFARSFDDLLSAVEHKRRAVLATRVPVMALDLGTAQGHLHRRLQDWQDEGFGRRLWLRDPTVFGTDWAPELVDRLGWLALPDSMRSRVPEITAFADEVRSEGFRHILLLGMGGSSLAPEMFQSVFGNAGSGGERWPALTVLDSTHPRAVESVLDSLDLARTLVVVSSKSGSTLETDSLRRILWQRIERAVQTPGDRSPGMHFAAITDPGSSLGALAKAHGYRHLFESPPDVGGRYSALSPFGLVPAALIGVDIAALLDGARAMALASGPDRSEFDNLSLILAAALVVAHKEGRDKLTLRTSPGLSSLPDWLEQLVAESLGKDGKGILPVAGENAPEAADDRLFIAFSLADEDEPEVPEGAPLLHIGLDDASGLGAELFRWELATAAAGAALGVQPFDQPDVQLAKEMAKQAMAGGGDVADHPPTLTGDAASRRSEVESFLSGGDHLVIQAFLAPTDDVAQEVSRLRELLAKRFGRPVTVGWGPRFLHSTGQLHKGGPERGRYLQLVDQPAVDLPVPGTDFDLARLVRGQADGDAAALRHRNRRVLRADLGADAVAALRSLREVLAEAETAGTAVS